MSSTSPTIYRLHEFQEKYRLEQPEAQRILNVVGSARADLDAFMLVYRDLRQAERWLLDVAAHPER